MISAHAGWRSMIRVTPAARPTERRFGERSGGSRTLENLRKFAPLPFRPPGGRGHFGSRFAHPNATARRALDCQYLFAQSL
jgi:hypothetical protein